ncbi:MAG: NAD(P)/FAD-dependent oxidoreductase [Alphaproteobacteria bacterium]|nr:NAD(P)/FAD-dependent oxidoreductase [Alphaproteobacteria bacterium]
MKTAVVIGSGMGGLTSAVLLGMAGYRVTVYEQHYRPGGLLHRFFREASPYDTGFHYCGGVGPTDVLGRVLRHLGVYEHIQFLPLDPDGFDRLLFPGFEFRVPVGVERYRARLKQTFPHEAEGIDAFIADLLEAIGAYGLYALRTEFDLLGFLRWEEVSLSTVIDRHIRDPRLKAVLCGQIALYGVPPGQAPFGLHAVILHHFLAGANRIEGGGDRLAKVMVQRLKELGGTLRLRAEVVGVLVEGREAVGVELADGTVQKADMVVSNMHPRALLPLLPSGAVRKAYYTRVTDQRVGVAHLGVYLRVDGPVPSIGNTNIYSHDGFDPEDTALTITPDRVPFYYASAPGEGLVKRRSGSDVILMLGSLDHSAVAPYQNSRTGERPPEYTALKDSLTRACVEALYRDFPDLRGRVTRIESSTALTTEHFTRSPNGAMYGHYHSVDQMGRYRPSQLLRVRNLVQVGQGVFAPGVLGTALSAYYGLGFFLGIENLVRELRAA